MNGFNLNASQIWLIYPRVSKAYFRYKFVQCQDEGGFLTSLPQSPYHFNNYMSATIEPKSIEFEPFINFY